jgi:hypothetical protein
LSKYDINDRGQLKKGHEARVHLNFDYRKWGDLSRVKRYPDKPLRLQLSQDKKYVFVYNFST